MTTGLRQSMTLRRGGWHRRAGSAYVMILGLSAVLMVIGLAAASVARIDTRNVTADNDWAEAQMLAFSAAENAMMRIAVTEDWRDTLSSPVSISMGRGTMQWQAVDEADGQLADDASDPVTILATGQVGASRYKLALRCAVMGDPLEALNRCMVAGEGIRLGRGAILTASGAAVSTNGDFHADKHMAWLLGDLEADGVWWKKNVIGTATKHATPFDMPASDVVDTYRDKASRIYGHRLIYRQAIGPGRNPWGSANTNGVYYIDAGNSDVTIRDSRILGTLVVRCRKLTIAGNVHMESYRSDMPTLIVDGDLELDYWSLGWWSSLRERAENTNFNPPGVPYEGHSDHDDHDTYPSEIRGLVHVRGDLELDAMALVRGTILCEGQAQCNGVNKIIHDADLADRQIQGYTTGDGQLKCESWRRVTEE